MADQSTAGCVNTKSAYLESGVQAAEWRVLQGAALWLQRRAPLMSGAAVLQSSNQMASKSGSPYFCQCSGLNEILAEAGFVY